MREDAGNCKDSGFLQGRCSAANVKVQYERHSEIHSPVDRWLTISLANRIARQASFSTKRAPSPVTSRNMALLPAGTYIMSHEKNPSYFPLNPGSLIGILIIWVTIGLLYTLED